MRDGVIDTVNEAVDKSNKDDNFMLNWACTVCGCLHIATESDLLFDDLTQQTNKNNSSGEDGQSTTILQFVDVTELRETISTTSSIQNRIESKLPTQYKGVCLNAQQKPVCGNCYACQQHSDVDCRICFKFTW